jgi:hypothetical protein
VSCSPFVTDRPDGVEHTVYEILVLLTPFAADSPDGVGRTEYKILVL